MALSFTSVEDVISWHGRIAGEALGDLSAGTGAVGGRPRASGVRRGDSAVHRLEGEGRRFL
jgi:hypothetical protein